MPPVAAAIGGLLGIGGAAISFGSIATALIKVAAGIGLSYVAKALAGKPENLVGVGASKPSGIQTSFSSGDSAPRSFIVGRWATAGRGIYLRPWQNPDGTPHAFIVQVIRLSDLPVTGIVDAYIDGKKVTYGSGAFGDRGFAIPEYRKDGKEHLWIKFYDGTQNQSDAYLVDKFNAGGRNWSPAHVGIGCAYAIVTARYNEKLFSGRPEAMFVLDGLKLYDITQDSSAGGSGGQLWDYPQTWQHTVNPMVIIYNLMRGISYQGKWVYGLQTVGAPQLPLSPWAAAIAECNLPLTNDRGETFAQYRAGAEIFIGTEIGAEIQEFLKCCNGRIADCGGVYKPKCGAQASSGTPIFSFTDNELMLTDEHEFSMFPSLDDTVNGIDATFIAPGDAWTEKALPPRRIPSYEVQDDHRQQIADVTYAHVWNKSQAQLLSNAILNESRRFRRHVVVLPPEAFVLEPLDFVSWTSDRNGYINKLFRIDSVGDRSNGDQIVGLQEVDPADYNWTPSMDIPMADGTQLIERPPAQPLTLFAAQSITSTGDDGRQIAGIRATWFSTDLDDVDRVKFEVRRSGNPALVSTPSTLFPLYGYYDITAGINGNTRYEVRGIFQDVDNRRDFTWSPWIPVQTTDVKINSNQIIASLLELIYAGSASGRVITQQVLPAPAGFQTLYRMTVYGTGANPVASGMYLYVSSTGVPGVIFDAATFAVGPFSSVPGDVDTKAKVFPFMIEPDGTVKLKNTHIQALTAAQIVAGEIYASHVHFRTLTADKFETKTLSDTHGIGGGVNASVGIKRSGGIILVGNFNYNIDNDEHSRVGIFKEGGSTKNPIQGSYWRLDPNAHMKGNATIVTVDTVYLTDTEIAAGVTKKFYLREYEGNGKISDLQLIALRVAD